MKTDFRLCISVLLLVAVQSLWATDRPEVVVAGVDGDIVAVRYGSLWRQGFRTGAVVNVFDMFLTGDGAISFSADRFPVGRFPADRFPVGRADSSEPVDLPENDRTITLTSHSLLVVESVDFENRVFNLVFGSVYVQDSGATGLHVRVGESLIAVRNAGAHITAHPGGEVRVEVERGIVSVVTEEEPRFATIRRPLSYRVERGSSTTPAEVLEREVQFESIYEAIQDGRDVFDEAMRRHGLGLTVEAAIGHRVEQLEHARFVGEQLLRNYRDRLSHDRFFRIAAAAVGPQPDPGAVEPDARADRFKLLFERLATVLYMAHLTHAE